MHLSNKVLVIDNFYENPDKVREIALKQEYKDCKDPLMGGSWPGFRSKYLHHIDESLMQEFRDNLMGNLLEGLNTRYNCYFETMFQLCYAEHGDSWIHTDIGKWEITHVGVIYLHPDPPPNSGTLIYDLKKECVDEFKAYAAKHNNLWTDLNRDTEEFHKWFELTLNVPNKYNRAIIYSPHRWHKSDTYFGNSVETGRLFQPLFARIKYEGNTGYND